MRKRMGRKRNSNAVTGGPNTCRITETYDLGDILLNAPEEYFQDGIPANTRAAAVAPNFGLYRMAKMEYTIRPYYDTFAPSTGTGSFPVNVPYLYWKMNRFGDAPAAFNAEFLREQGSKPIRLDDKIIHIKYKPNILLADAGRVAAGLNGGSGQVKMTPWLSTDSEVEDGVFALSSTAHYGHLSFVEGAGAGAANAPIARVELKIVWEFKNPRGITASSTAPLVAKKTVVKST